MIRSILEINKLILPVVIGVGKEERAIAQKIEFNLTIKFVSLPIACKSDNLIDAICYDNLVKLIKEFCLNKEFKLIEHLCFALHQHLKNSLNLESQLKLQICKSPPIAEIKGNCCFVIEDC